MDKNVSYKCDVSTERIDAWRAQGKLALGTVCCHAPFELIHAAGALPVRMRATGCGLCADSDAYLGNDTCGFTKGILQNLIDGVYHLDGLVTSNGCNTAPGIYTSWDAISRERGLKQFFFEFAAPTMLNASSERFFGGQMEDLRDALQEYTGKQITDDMVRASIRTYNSARELVQEVYELRKADSPVLCGAEALRATLMATQMPIEEYIEYMKGFLADVKARTETLDHPLRVMLVGSALDDPEYVQAIENEGLLVVADLNSFGTRFLRDPLVCGDDEDVFDALGRHYLNRSSCPRFHDGSDTIHEYILNAAKEYKVDGIIVERLKYCRKWEAESAVLQELFNQHDIPCLQLDRDEKMTAQGQFSIRVEAFREMLESKKD
jgi:benzoyl-CoA reductase subunit C